MEAITLKAAAKELHDRCVPFRVRTVHQSSHWNLILPVGGREGGYLVVSADPNRPTLYRTDDKPSFLPSPTAFCRLARKRLGGLVLAGIESPGMERTASFVFAPSVSDPPRCRLVAELMGRWSNLVLVDEGTGAIVDSLHHVEPEGEGERVMLPGEPYLPPPSGGRESLDTVETRVFEEHFLRWKTGESSLFAPFVGLGPGLLALAGERADKESGADLLEALRSVIRSVREGDSRPVYYPGRRRVLPLPVRGWENEPRHEFPTMSEAAEYEHRRGRGGDEERKYIARERKSLRRRIRKLEEKLRRMEKEGGSEGEELGLREAGQAILARMGEVPRGAATFTVEVPGGEGPGEREVELDPALDPRKNAERYFHLAKKARRRREMALRKLPSLRREKEGAEQKLEELESLTPGEIEERVRSRKEKSAKGAKKGPIRAGTGGIREYRNDRGWRILVGKNSRGNDRLTARVASPDDPWFHARDYPGAHVVLKEWGPEKEPPAEALAAAAEAAAWHSAARGEGMVDVSWTRKKHVRKVKGQPPGTVLVPKAETIRVRPRVPSGFTELKGT